MILSLVLILTLAGCSIGQPLNGDLTQSTDDITEDPEYTDGGSDTQGLGPIESFSFSLRWGGHQESYDSTTGILIKEGWPAKHAPEDYTTTYLLTEEQKQQIYDLLADLDVTSYPDTYDPQMGKQFSNPDMTLILSVSADPVQKTIAAENIAISYSSEDAKGQAFLSACKAIIDLLEQTEEWKALPEYDYFLD